MIYECANAYYLSYINRIGGIESHFYYLAKKYGKYDIAIVYRQGDQKQIDRLKRYVRTIQIKSGDKIICKKLFCCFNHDILSQAEAEEKYFVLHGDYKSMVEQKQLDKVPDGDFDGYLGVSQLVCDSFFDLTGKRVKNVYQPVVLEEVDKPLMFISATRLTAEKGWNRMVRLAETMNSHKVNYMWFVFTNSENKCPENVYRMPTRLDIADKVGGFDAYIQLSDNEGYCLSVVESLMRNVPVIVTDLPVFKELGLNDTNSIRLPLDMSNIPIARIKNIRELKFTYKQPKDKWNDVLDHTASKHSYKTYIIKATDGWEKHKIFDIKEQEYHRKGDMWEVDEERYNELLRFEKENDIKLIER